MKQKSVGLTLRAFIIALALILVAGSPALPPFDGVAYAQSPVTTLSHLPVPGTSNLQLDWTAVDNADSYRLWKAEGLVTTVAGWGNAPHMTFDGSTIQYVDTAVTAGTTYSYVLEVYDGDTRLGYSNVLEVIGTAKPTAQPDVTLELMGLNAIKVSWTSVPTATHYRVRYWSAGMSGWMDLDDDATGLTLTHENLEAGRQYYYIVRGENSGGDGPYSGSPGNYESLTLPATSDTPTLSLKHTSRTVVEVSWTPAPAGSTYDLQRRRVVTVTDTGGTTTEVAADTTTFARLPSALLTATSYTDSAANFVAPVDVTTAGSETVHRVMYYYRVRAVDSNDQEGDWSAVKSVEIPRSGAVLAAPGGLATSVLSSSNIRVSWNNVNGADYYELQWKSGDRSYSTSIRVNRPDSGNPSYSDTGLTPATKYTYRVRGVDVNGPGDWSGEQSGTTLSVTAEAGQMPKVTGLTVTDETTNNTADERKAKLTWNAVSTATHYEIQRYDPSTAVGWQDLTAEGTGTANSVTRIAAAASPSHEDIFPGAAEADNAAGKTFFYIVSAVDEGLDGDPAVTGDNEMGEWSDHKGVTFKAHKPNVPTDLEGVKTSGTSILVSWTAPVAVPTSGAKRGLATSYTLRWKAANSQTWRDIAVTGTSYHHTGLSGSTSYSYRVRAQNSGGVSDWVDDLPPVVLGNTLSPPTGLRAVDATTGDPAVPGIKVTWNAVSTASSYEIQRFGAGTDDDMWGDLSDDAGTPAGSAFTAVSGTSHTNGGDAGFSSGVPLSPSTTYLYRVRTVTDTGTKSGWSVAVSGTTKATTASAPTLVAASTGMSMIRLSWTAVTGATGYEIEFLTGSYADAAAFGAANLNRSKITVTGGSHRHYVHAGRTAGTRYSYRIRAMLAQGGETGWSAPAQQYTKPARPVLSASSTVSSTMVLSWDAVSFVTTTGAANRLSATPATNYQIQRRPANSREWTSLTLTSTDGGTDGAAACANNKCMFTDGHADPTAAGALEASTRYYYRIRATVTQDGETYTSYWAYRNQQTSN
jgi:titin